MCGLAGVLSRSNLINRDKDMFRDLMVVSQLRGFHSTGVAFGRKHTFKNNKTSIIKGAINASQFLGCENVVDGFKSHLQFMIGHCRWATMGNVDFDNSHPVATDHIIVTHNGTINSLRGEAKHRDMNDSRILTERIAKKGLFPTLDELKPGDAYALVIYDREKQLIHFIRNEKRTLYLAYYDDNIMWASEKCFLDMALTRNGKEEYKIEALPIDTLLTIDMDDQKKPIAVTEYKRKVIETKLPVKQQEKKVLGPVRVPDTQSTSKTATGQQQIFYRGFDRKLIDTVDAEFLLNQGCMSCGKKYTFDDKVFWYSQSDYECQSCRDSTNCNSSNMGLTFLANPFQSHMYKSQGKVQ